MSEVGAKLQEYSRAVEAEEQASQRVMAVLIELKKVAGGSTFEVGGQYYQVRNRRGKTYLCELSGPPKGRPKKIRQESGPITVVPDPPTEKTIDTEEQ